MIYGMRPLMEQAAAAFPSLFPARIVAQQKGFYQAVSAAGELTA